MIVTFIKDYRIGGNLVVPDKTEYHLGEGEVISLREGKFLDMYDLYDLEKQQVVTINYE